MIRVNTTTMRADERDAAITVELETSVMASQSTRELELNNLGRLAAYLNDQAHFWLKREYGS